MMRKLLKAMRQNYFILIIGCFFSLFVQAKSDYLLPTSVVNLYLQLHSPITKDFSPFLIIQLNNTDVSTSESSQRIQALSSIAILLPNQRPIKGRINFSSSFRYDNLTKKIILVQPQIESIEVENKYASTEQQLAQLNPVIAQLLNGITVYEFTNKNAMTPSAPSHIQLEAQGIRFYFD